MKRYKAVIDHIAADVDELARPGGPGTWTPPRCSPTDARDAADAWPSRTWNSGPSAPARDCPPHQPATGAGLGRMAGRAIPARRDRPAAGLHRQPVPATLTTRPPARVQETGHHSGAHGSIGTGTPTLPRVPANPRVRDGELRGIHAVWADPAPGFVRTPGRRGRASPGTGVLPGSFLPPPPDDPLPGGQVKGTLRVSLRDRCATPDMPVRSQDRQLSVSGRKRGRRCRLRARDWMSPPGLQHSQFRRSSFMFPETSSTVRPTLLKRGKPRSRDYRSY